GSANAFPHDLSGGNQQPAAPARALAPARSPLPRAQPFSNLAIDTRHPLAGALPALLKSTRTTVLIATQPQREAVMVADRIGATQRGRMLQWDRAEALYRRPADRFVADFIGRGALVAAASLGLAEAGDVLLRPESLAFDPAGAIRGVLVAVGFRGPHHVGSVRLASGHVVEVDLCDGHAAQKVGSEITLRLVDSPLAFPAGAAA